MSVASNFLLRVIYQLPRVPEVALAALAGTKVLSLEIVLRWDTNYEQADGRKSNLAENIPYEAFLAHLLDPRLTSHHEAMQTAETWGSDFLFHPSPLCSI